jgi:hypothetical protein
VCVTVFWGPTGTGKSHRVFSTWDIEDFYVVPEQHGNSVWLDGYDGEEIAVFDDFNWEEIPIKTFLRLLDKWPVTAQVKNGMTYPCWTKVYITSNINPVHWYPNAHPEHQNALMRRLETGGIHHITEREN